VRERAAAKVVALASCAERDRQTERLREPRDRGELVGRHFIEPSLGERRHPETELALKKRVRPRRPRAGADQVDDLGKRTVVHPPRREGLTKLSRQRRRRRGEAGGSARKRSREDRFALLENDDLAPPLLEIDDRDRPLRLDL